jgi:hypothetical protein
MYVKQPLYFVMKSEAALFDDFGQIAIISMGGWFGLNLCCADGPIGHPSNEVLPAIVREGLESLWLVEKMRTTTNITISAPSICLLRMG